MDPEDEISRSPGSSPIPIVRGMGASKNENDVMKKESTSVPSNFIEQSGAKRKPMPLSPNVRRHTRTLKSETNSSLPDVSGSSASDSKEVVHVATSEDKESSSVGEDAATTTAAAMVATKVSSPAQSTELTAGSFEPSPPPSRDALSPVGEAGVLDIERRGTTASRKASSTIARRRFLKAGKAISFTNKLASLSRTSMLRARAPKEFSVLERVQRLEEKLEAAKEGMDTMKSNTEERLEQLEINQTEGWIYDAVKALASRMQKVETLSLSSSTKTGEPAEQTVQVLKKIQTALSTHIESTENLAEESFVNRLLSVQQRIVETANSYQGLAAEISKIKMPASDDELRAFKILQYHAKVQGIRHRLTHLDAENLVETLLFNRMKQEKEVQEKHGLHISANITEAYTAIQEKVDVCVKLNRELWDKLVSVDKAAGTAWGIIGRMMTGRGGIGGPNEGRLSVFETVSSRRLDIEQVSESAPESAPLSLASPVNVPTSPIHHSMPLEVDIEEAVDRIMERKLEKFALDQNKLSVVSNGLQAMDEKLSSNSKTLQELESHNKELQKQLAEKADDAAVQMALRASRMAQASVEGKADVEALESMESFLQKCRKEVVKLRSTQEAGIAGTRRILERKLKKVIKDTQELAESQAANQGAFIGTGQVQLSSRSGQIEKGVRWKSDNSKFLPAHPAVSGSESVVVTKGNFLVGMPGGVKGRMMAREDPPRSDNIEPASEALRKMLVSSGLGNTSAGEADETTRPTVPKHSPLKPSPIKRQHNQGGHFWGKMDVMVPKGDGPN